MRLEEMPKVKEWCTVKTKEEYDKLAEIYNEQGVTWSSGHKMTKHFPASFVLDKPRILFVFKNGKANHSLDIPFWREVAEPAPWMNIEYGLY